MADALRERLLLMETNPRRRNRGQVPSEIVAEALRFQSDFAPRELSFNTAAISDCGESLEQMLSEKREIRECRDMMWEDHYATHLNEELVRSTAARKKKLAQETATLSQLTSDWDKWSMAIELHMYEFLSDSLSRIDTDRRKEYFNSCHKSGQTPLHRACKANDVALVQLLISLGAELVVKDESGKTVFHTMAENRLAALFRVLNDQLTDTTRSILSQVDKSGGSVLHAAASSGCDKILELLLTDPDCSSVRELIDLQKAMDNNTPLHFAARNGHLACIKCLMEIGSANPAILNFRGSNAFHLALQQTFDVEKLAGVFVNQTPQDLKDSTFNTIDDVTGQMSLHTAIIKGFIGLSLELIQDKVVQVNTATRDGAWSPLHLAVMNGSLKLVNALLAAGAITDVVDADGQTPLLLACLGGRLEIIRVLLENHANPAHQNKQAHSALHYLAAFCRDRQLLEDFIGAGADVHAKSLKLNTPLHFAAMNGNEVATQVLLAHGASPSLINEDKRSVVYLAKKWRHRGVEDLVKPPEPDSAGTPASVVPATRGNQRPVTPVASSHHRQLAGSRAKAVPSQANASRMLGLETDDSDSDSLFAFEDDEPIVPPSYPWPTGGSWTSQNFSQLRERFMDRSNATRAPLGPIVVAQDRRPAWSPASSPIATTSTMKTLGALQLTRTTNRFLPGPVHVPWEMTVPVASLATAQRKLKPSIRANVGLLRDHLAHAQELHWPEQAARPPVRTLLSG